MVLNANQHCIELVSGDYLDLLKPDPAVITTDVVAHHLATINRYGGAARRPISVAEHACLVADRLAVLGATPATQLAGLHHDDPEAFLGDVVRPLKIALDGSGNYDLLTRRMWRACKAAFGLLHEALIIDWDLIKQADDWALAAEAYHLLPSRGAGWFCDGYYVPRRDDEQHSALYCLGLPWGPARELWLAYERRLRNA